MTANPTPTLATSRSVRMETHGAITQITLCRADKANALSSEMVDALMAAMTNAVASVERQPSDAATIVIRSEGKHFCSGFDLSTVEAEDDERLIARLEKLETLLQTIYYAPCATVALVQGSAFGAGFDLAMACDYRLAESNARLRMPAWRMGIALGTRRTAARVGREIAFEFLRSAMPIDAGTAQSQRFITEVADSATWERRVQEIATEVGQHPARGYARLKRILLSDTRERDMTDLLDSLRATELKPRMQRYLAKLSNQI
jgi:enoyl-CoA hydratase/carnithine racemase